MVGFKIANAGEVILSYFKGAQVFQIELRNLYSVLHRFTRALSMYRGLAVDDRAVPGEGKAIMLLEG